MSHQEISILIPAYHSDCVRLVRELSDQANRLNVAYEIIVADDGSTDKVTIEANREISEIVNCRFIERQANVGRAAIRNFLAREASFAYLLYIDSDMTVVSPDFLSRYMSSLPAQVVDGGVAIIAHSAEQKKLLRYLYEKAEAPNYSATQRQQSPFQHFRTTNFLIRRSVMLAYPFDERFRHYGYEDVMLGKVLHHHHVAITHIDNPVGFHHFESNPEFVAKTEEGLRTLYEFRSDLRGYSRLLTFVQGIHIPAILWLLRLWHRMFGAMERRNLCGSRPCLSLFKLYRLGYYLSLLQHREG